MSDSKRWIALIRGAAVVILLVSARTIDNGSEALDRAGMGGAFFLSCWLAGSVFGWVFVHLVPDRLLNRIDRLVLNEGWRSSLAYTTRLIDRMWRFRRAAL